jgi:hypothetical protein
MTYFRPISISEHLIQFIKIKHPAINIHEGFTLHESIKINTFYLNVTTLTKELRKNEHQVKGNKE